MELPKPTEVVKDIGHVAYNVGRFVLDRVQHGAWIHQPHFDSDPVVRPANIQVYPQENIIKGEE